MNHAIKQAFHDLGWRLWNLANAQEDDAREWHSHEALLLLHEIDRLSGCEPTVYQVEALVLLESKRAEEAAKAMMERFAKWQERERAAA